MSTQLQYKRFNRLFQKKKDMDFYVFDVETWGLDARPESFALGVIYGKDYVFKTTNINELRRELLSRRFKHKTIFAHNALYDLSTVFGNIIKTLDNKAVFNGSQFILARKDSTTFADSINIFATSLETIGKLIGYPKGETPDKFKKGIKEEITEEDFKYCIQDCRILYTALIDIFAEIGCIRVTLASLSMAYFRRNYLKDTFFYNENVYKFFDSYYGGRVECFRLGKVYAKKFDINSMYPNAMKNSTFPNPAKITKIDSPTLQKLIYELEYNEGLATIKVKHKKNFFGYLPVKSKGKLIFPVGTFTGTWNFPEIRLALKHKMITILEVKEIYSAPKQESPFKEFVDDLYTKRLNSNDEFKRYQLKIILNSLYGKFAQKRKFDSTYVENLSTEQIDLFSDKAKIVPFNMERNDAYIIEEKEEYSYNTIPSYSSYITSNARVQLLELIHEYKDNDIVYCDTDSLAFQNDKIPVRTGSGLGEFKAEPKIIIEILGNKSYIELNEKYERKTVLKGVKKGSEEIAPNTYKTTKMLKPKSALRRNLEPGQFIEEIKTLSFSYDKREIFPDGTTEPLFIRND